MCDRVLSVLVVNYNGGAYLPACLGSLEKQTIPRERFEVIVADNGSTDGSAEVAAERFPWVRVERFGRNVGFAEGNNLVAGFARGTHLVLLNPDTVADPFWLVEIDRAIDEHPGRLIASKLVIADRPDHLNSAGLFLLRDGRGADRGFRQPDDGRYESGGLVFAGCAAALAVPAPPPGEPLFDPRYFLYSEDLELGWRHLLAGRNTVFAPRAVVRHLVGGSGGDGSPLFWFHTERNRALNALKHGDPVLAVTTGLGLMLRAVRAVAFALLRQPTPKYRWPNAVAVVKAAGAYLGRVPITVWERCGW